MARPFLTARACCLSFLFPPFPSPFLFSVPFPSFPTLLPLPSFPSLLSLRAQALYCEIEHSTSVFFFHDGSLVCWQATESQIERCLFDARQAQSEPYVASAVETEEMNYVRKAEGSVDGSRGARANWGRS